MYDVIIIGAGPAGISAGLYTKRANLNTLILYSGKTALSKAKIENYYGFSKGIDGEKLYNEGIKQAKNIGIEVKKKEVIGIENNDKYYTVKTVKNSFDTKTVILSTGSKKIKPDIPGIIEFEGKGISYCAICDAFFYKNKNVAVIGNGKFAISEADKLSNVANKVIILTNGLKEPECKYEVNKNKIKAVLGNEKIEKIQFENGDTIDIDGIFIALGEAGAGDFAKTLGIVQNNDIVVVNEKMETNIKGIYACGNITGGLLQVNKAVYEGAVAGLSAVKYIKEGRKEN